jgi:hypothetical protein
MLVVGHDVVEVDAEGATGELPRIASMPRWSPESGLRPGTCQTAS